MAVDLTTSHKVYTKEKKILPACVTYSPYCIMMTHDTDFGAMESPADIYS